MNDIIQLKITLQGTEPPIWRRILVDKKTTFFELHHIIQIAMGWDNYHLYEFKIKDYRIGEPYKDDEGWGDKLIDASKKTLDSVISDTKVKFEYTYDFGDSWQHLIKVEKFLQKAENVKYPICIDGELNCPPEDCGGVWGFYDLMEIIKNNKHPEHNEMLEWLGGHYDAEHFNKELVNKELEPLERQSRTGKTQKK